ncbi:MAG: spermidine synthase [Ilumatobacteraceae bacterium]
MLVRAAQPSGLALRAQLVLTAFLMLFIELALIRWLGANVLYLAYFSNVVLLGSFLGIGLGFLWTSRSSRSLFPFAPLLLATLIVLVRVLEVKVGIAGGSLIFFGLDTSGPPRWIVLPVVFLAVAAVMVCIGDGVARSFQRLANLDAYQLDLVGSLLGSIAFALLAFVEADPIVWGSVATIGFAVALRPRGLLAIAMTLVPLVVALGFLVAESAEEDTTWTPYYKVHTIPIADQGGLVAEVNGIPTWLQIQAVGNPIYETVYDRITDQDPGDVLIIGAGSGNDVAVANARGADRVDAVEIDAHLLDLGRQHPDRPYDDPRVVTHVGDGRAYLESTDRTWDTILLALPDSLTLLQGQSSVRLESYLFTREAAESYRDHLAPGGSFAMYNYYREPWLVERYAGTLEDVFGNPPCVSDAAANLSVLVASEDPAAVSCPDGQRFVRTADTPAPATDDHPFPYLRTPSIPGFYLLSIAGMLAISLIGVRALGGPLRAMRPFADLFFMGVAFLLLETKNVVQFALLFGTTWFVNAFVFIGVLASVLLAVGISKRIVIRRTAWLYGALLASVGINWLVPGRALLGLPFVPRLAVAVVLAFLPIFTANLVFASRFRDTADSTAAFGANLIGAMIGGVLEYASLVIGYRHLLLLVAALYGAAFLLRPPERSPTI